MAKDFKQMEGVDYNEHSPQRLDLRVALVVPVASLDHMDVATAFLYAKLEEETYGDNPKGMAPVGGEGKVW